MKKLHNLVMAVLLVLSTNALAGAQKDYFASEVWTAAYVAHTLARYTTDLATETTFMEPLLCWPFPVRFDEFYRAVQDEVNLDVESYPKRERGKLGVTIGGKVIDAIHANWGC